MIESGEDYLAGCFKAFIDEHREGLRMAASHGNFDDALKVVFVAGYDRAIKDVYMNVDDGVEDTSEYGI